MENKIDAGLYLTRLIFLVQRLPIRHLLDVMHIERNICKSMLKLLFGTKDTAASRLDMEEEGIRDHLWIQRGPVAGGNYFKPPTPYVLKKEEQRIFLEQLDGIKLPTGYCGPMKKHIINHKIGNMKSHDFHIFFQFILPICLRHLLDSGPRQAIIRLAKLFTMICKKVINVDELERLQLYAAETMCLMEIWFPPSFFDIMVHLPIHLVRQIKLCGPIANAWCYPVERHLNVLKKYIRNRAHPEGAIANAYMFDEALGFCTEYLKLYPHTRRRIWDDEEELGDCGELLEGKASNRELTSEEQRGIHSWIIRNSEATRLPWRYTNDNP